MSRSGRLAKVTHIPDIVAYGVMQTPGLVIDDEVVATGRIPSPNEIIGWLQTARVSLYKVRAGGRVSIVHVGTGER